MKFLVIFLYCCSAAAWANQDADFLAARTAYLAGNITKLDSAAAKLKQSPLELYISYYQLRLQLDTAPADKVLAFLSRPEDNPVLDRLRGEWLKVLGSKQQWGLFNQVYPRLIKEDTELNCYALQARRATQADKPLPEVAELWFTGKSLPDSCGPVFDTAMDTGIITPEMIWQRLRLAFEAGNTSLAKRLAERLRNPHQFPADSIASAASDPDRYLSRVKLDKANDGQRAVAMFALQRLARQSADIAFAHWSKVAVYFPVPEQHYFYSWLGYEAARTQDAKALQWYRAAGNTPLNPQQAAWRVRAALRAQDWTEVSRGIGSMAANQQSEPAWRYWKARALIEQNHRAEAMQLLAPLSREFNFYGQLANEELATTPVMDITPASYTPSDQDIATMSALPGVQRTIALYRMDLRADALEEWRWLVRNLNDKELLTAAEIARRNEMYDRAIGAADLTVSTHDFSLRYLAPYRDALQSHLKDNNLDEAWVYGLMRQESRFATSARSNVGASGLMQIMPSTARWVAKRLGLKSYRDHLIQQLDTNLRLGTYYMKNVLSTADDSPVMASAAYNAGPSRARKWRGDQALEGAIYAESIPFDETRDYVKKVMSNTAYYAKEFGSPTPSLKARLGIIAAKTSENQQAPADEK